MAEFFNGLSGLQRFFYIVAIPATLILIIQTIMTIFGLSDGDDFDVDSDVDSTDGIADFRFFSIRGLIAFFTIFGWVGVVLSDQDLPVLLNLFLSLLSGLVAMFVVGYLFYSINKLQSSGNISLSNAIGLSGEVYIPIPAARKGVGKVQLLLQERFIEVEAITDDHRLLKTGAIVQVIAVFNNNTVIVRPINK